MPKGSDYSVRWDSSLQGYQIRVPHGELIYAESFFDKKVSDRSVEYFQENDTLDWRQAKWKSISNETFGRIGFSHIKWQQDNIKLYGKKIPLPRLTAWYGDRGASYT